DRADTHVAGGGVHAPVAADHADLDVAGGAVEPSLATDEGNLDVAAGGADLGVAGDVGELDVAGAGLDVNALEDAAALDVGRASLDLDDGLDRTGDRDKHLSAAKPLGAAADVDHDVLPVRALVQLDAGGLDRLDRRLVVAKRLELDDGLALRAAGVEPDLA